MNDFLLALLGGAIIGLAVSLMLLWNGRVTGISGIIYGAAIKPSRNDKAWRWYFLAGLALGGFMLKLFYPGAFTEGPQAKFWTVVVGGLLVGFGTTLGSGCTSGHGVCGISRLSPRSIIATLTFISAGVIAVFLFRKFGVLP
jgi:uncharacterized membrane protein YedE/YeeE